MTPWTVAHQASLSMEFPRQEYWSGLLFPSPGDLPDPGIKLASPALQADSTTEPPREPHIYVFVCVCVCIYIYTLWPFRGDLHLGNETVFKIPKCNFLDSYSRVLIHSWCSTSPAVPSCNVSIALGAHRNYQTDRLKDTPWEELVGFQYFFKATSTCWDILPHIPAGDVTTSSSIPPLPVWPLLIPPSLTQAFQFCSHT